MFKKRIKESNKIAKILTEKEFAKTIQAYGGFDPNSLTANGSQDLIKFGSIENLFAMFEASRQGSYFTSHYQKYFIKYEHLITNDEMFWLMCPIFWLISTTGFNEEVFSRNGRQSIPWERRQFFQHSFYHNGMKGFDSTPDKHRGYDYQNK